MKSLDHWNFADRFTGVEAACLIVGVDPSNPNAETYKSDHLLVRLKAAYSLAIKSDAVEGCGPMIFYPRSIYEFKEELDLVLPISEQKEPLPPALQKEIASKKFVGMTHEGVAENNNLQEEDGIWLDLSWPPMSPDPAALQSTAILEIRSEVFPEDLSMDFSYGPPLEGPTPEEWLASDKSSFENQKFSRQELHRWLQVVGFESAYCFGSTSIAQTSSIEKSSAKMTNLPWRLRLRHRPRLWLGLRRRIWSVLRLRPRLWLQRRIRCVPRLRLWLRLRDRLWLRLQLPLSLVMHGW